MTIVSYLGFPDRFIYFGILHAIVVAGLFGFILRDASTGLILGAAVSVLVVDALFSRAFDLSPWWAGEACGTSQSPRVSRFRSFTLMSPSCLTSRK